MELHWHEELTTRSLANLKHIYSLNVYFSKYQEATPLQAVTLAPSRKVQRMRHHNQKDDTCEHIYNNFSVCKIGKVI